MILVNLTSHLGLFNYIDCARNIKLVNHANFFSFRESESRHFVKKNHQKK